MKLKITVILICAVLLILCIIGAVYAINAGVSVYMEITVRGENFEQTVTPYRYSRTLYCVFLPSCTDRELICELDGADSIVIGGKEYSDGDAIDVSIDESFEVEFRRGAARRSIRYMFIPSARVGDVFINSEDGEVTVVSKSGIVSYSGGADAEGYGAEAKTDILLRLRNASELLSMGCCEEWVLLSNAADRTHMRNKFAYDLFLECGAAGAPESEYVDLFVDGEYRGLYLLVQSVQSSENGEWLTTSGGVRVEGGAGAALDFELAVSSPDGVSPETGIHYSEYIDVGEWALGYLMAEVLSDTGTEHIFSCFYESEGMLYQTFETEFSSKLGNCVTVWSDPCRLLRDAGALGNGSVCWYTYLCRQPEFMSAVISLYEDLVQPRILNALCNELGSYRTLISRAKVLDDIVWEDRNAYSGPDIDDWQEQIYYLRGFLTERQEFLTSLWLEQTDYSSIVIRTPECSGTDSMIYYIETGTSPGPLFFTGTYFSSCGYSADQLRYEDGREFDVSEAVLENIFLELDG